MIRKSLRLDFIELHILQHASEGPLYGLWMIEELAEHGYWLSASQLYPKFHRLQKKGYLKRSEQVVDGKLRKYYRITREGRAYFKVTGWLGGCGPSCPSRMDASKAPLQETLLIVPCILIFRARSVFRPTAALPPRAAAALSTPSQVPAC